jgi:hypothetical protein
VRVWRLVHRRRCTLHRLSSYDSIQLEDTIPEAEFGQIRFSSDRERKEAVFAEIRKPSRQNCVEYLPLAPSLLDDGLEGKVTTSKNAKLANCSPDTDPPSSGLTISENRRYLANLNITRRSEQSGKSRVSAAAERAQDRPTAHASPLFSFGLQPLLTPCRSGHSVGTATQSQP